MVRVRRIEADDGLLLRSVRLAALADAPGDATITLAKAQLREERHWVESAAANASGPMQATFFALDDSIDLTRAGTGSKADGDGNAGDGARAESNVVGMVGAYANRDGTVNVVGLWSAPGFRDVGVAEALLAATAAWALGAGANRMRIWVVERNEHARRYYEDHGFVTTGLAMPYEPDPRINQLEMVLAL